jgi:hypothetical protein
MGNFMMRYLRAAAAAGFAIVLALMTLGSYAPPPRQVPPFLTYFGDGAEADPDPAGTITLSGDHNYANFTVPSGATVNIGEDFTQPPASVLLVRSPGTCTIAGTINGRGVANPVYTIAGIGGGGGGNPAAAGLQALGVISPSLTLTGAAGGAMGNPGGAGQDAAPLSDAIQTFVLDAMDSLFDSAGGMPGGAGAGTANPFDCHNAGPGNGGCAGAGLILVCRKIDFQSSAAVDLRGQDGFAGAAGTPAIAGGGGGGGGFFLTYAIAYLHSPANTGTVKLDGGAGGAGGDSTAGGGGKGSPGWSKFF